MDSQYRIRRLEGQIHALQGELDRLRALSPSTSSTDSGSEWAGRAGVALLLALAAAAMVALLRAESLTPVERVAIALGASAAALAYGLAGGVPAQRLRHGALALGLGGLYFGLYGAMSLPALEVLSPSVPRLPVLLACLLFCMLLAHARRSAVAAGTALATAYATAVLSGAEQSPDGLAYALCTGAACAVAALLLHAYHRWVSVTWIAFLGTYAIFVAFFREPPAFLPISDDRHFMASLVFLSLVFFIVSCACIGDQRPGHPRRPAVTRLAVANCAVYFLLVQGLMTEYAPRHVGTFYGAYAAVLGGLAVAAALIARRRSRLAEAFLAAALVVLAIAGFSLLSGGALWLTLAATNLILALLYARTRIVFFKAANLALVLVLFVACLWAVNWQGILRVGEYTVGSDAAAGVGIPLILVLAAAVYANLVRPRRSEGAHTPWFLEGTPLDPRDGHMSLIHAAAAALVLLTLTVFHAGDDAALPYFVAAEAGALLVAGYILFTPAVRMAAVALLAAAHVVFHFFEFSRMDTAPTTWTVALAVGTGVAALAWERDTKRAAGIAPEKHDLVGILPYLPALALAAQLVHRHIDGLNGPAVLNGIAVALLILALAVPYAGLRTAALFAFACGAVDFALRFRDGSAFEGDPAQPLIRLFPILFGLVAGERLLAWGDRHTPTDSPEKTFRTLLATGAATIAAAGIYLAAPPRLITPGFVALAMLLWLLSRAARERRYLWPARILFAVAIVRAAFHDFPALSPAGRAALLLIPAAAVLAVAAWRRLRRRRAPLLPASPLPEERTADGRPA